MKMSETIAQREELPSVDMSLPTKSSDDSGTADGEQQPLSPVSQAASPQEEDNDKSVKQPSTVRMSTRTRSTPGKLKSETETPVKKAATVPTKRKLQPVRGNWSSTHLLTNPKSKLTTINLPALLSLDRAWTELSREEQLELISLLPGASLPQLPEDEPLPNVPRQYLKTNSSFLSDVRLFQEDLSAGRYDSVWLRDAQKAMDRRAKGDFDDWKEKNREEFWGQKQKVDWNALAGETSQHSLSTLAEAAYIEVGDVWLLRVAQTKKDETDRKEQVTVEKEATVITISDEHNLSLSFPPARNKFSAPANGQDVSVNDISNPTMLLEAMLNEDGRLAGVRRGNAWKDFRCFRKNQDMGSLWDIRELYHHRKTREN